MTRIHALRLLALAAVLTLTSTTHASMIQWGYSWSAAPSFVTAGTGKVTFTTESIKFAKGDSSVVATNLQAVSTALPASPDVFSPADGNYSLTLTLTDVDSATSGTLTFTGKLQGQFSTLNANVTNIFNSPVSQSLLLGFNTYTVTMNSYTPPGPPNQGNVGSIGAFVQVSSLKPAEVVPEPTSMALAGLGAGFACFAGWKKRRRRKSVAGAAG